MSEQDTFRFSVVIPTYQRRELVLSCVSALERQVGAASLEVVVVVDGSTDETDRALRELDTRFPLAVVEQSNMGAAAARNEGASRARGELILFLDDDMEAERDLLAQHDRSHRQGADVVIGHIPLHPASRPGFLSATVGRWAERRLQSLLERNGRPQVDDLLTGQMSVRRDVFLRIGGFDTSFTHAGSFGGEDLDFGMRLLESGYRIVFNPEAISRQHYVVTPRQYLRQWRQAGRASVMLARRHPGAEERIFRRRETPPYRLGRSLRVLLREVVLALTQVGVRGSRIERWFFRVRDLEYLRGVRDAGGEPMRGRVRVLCYHAISDLAGAPVVEPYGVPPETFRRQLDLLSRRFRPISAEEFARYLSGGGVPRRAVLLTFDDCYQDLVEVALPMLRERGIPALAFAVTALIGGTSEWDAPLGAKQLPLADAAGLSELAGAAVAIGSHCRTHRRLDRLTNEEVRDEINGSIGDLERLGVPRPLFLAYPHGKHTKEVKHAAREAGLAGAFTVEAGLVRPDGDAYALPRIEVFRSDRGWRLIWKVAFPR